MDARHFDRIAKRISRRGLAAVLGAGLLAGPNEARARRRPRDVCGGQPHPLSRYCAGLRTCATDDDCAEGCECVERGAGCCYKVPRKGNKPGKRGRPRKARCVDFGPALRCTPKAGVPQ